MSGTRRASSSPATSWSRERFRGIRPAFGYPACPDHSEKQHAVRAARGRAGRARADGVVRVAPGRERERPLLRPPVGAVLLDRAHRARPGRGLRRRKGDRARRRRALAAPEPRVRARLGARTMTGRGSAGSCDRVRPARCLARSCSPVRARGRRRAAQAHPTKKDQAKARVDACSKRADLGAGFVGQRSRRELCRRARDVRGARRERPHRDRRRGLARLPARERAVFVPSASTAQVYPHASRMRTPPGGAGRRRPDARCLADIVRLSASPQTQRITVVSSKRVPVPGGRAEGDGRYPDDRRHGSGHDRPHRHGRSSFSSTDVSSRLATSGRLRSAGQGGRGRAGAVVTAPRRHGRRP